MTKLDISVLVCGSLAFDTLIVLDDKFKLSQPSGSEMPHNQNVYHVVPDLRREFGGCAGNLAYNLTLLTVPAVPVGTVGTDFALYSNWLDSNCIPRDRIMVVEHSYTAQTFVVLDMDDNRITAFHPGAMDFSHFNRLPPNITATLGVIAPDSMEGMRTHAQQFVEAMVPYLLYPGNSLRHMDSDDILGLSELAQWAVFNRREWAQVEHLTGLTPAQMGARMQAVILNLDKDGAIIYAHDAQYQIPPPAHHELNDLSGADDAFCAGLVYGLAHEIDWETAGRIATLMWYIKARHHGTQRHHFTMEGFKHMFKRTFGYALIT